MSVTSVSSNAVKKQDYTLKYEKHYCNLRTKQKMDPGGSLWQKILKEFVELFAISEKNYRSLVYLKTRGAVESEIKRQKYSKYWYIFHPFSLTRLYWETFMITILLFSLYFLPLRSSLLNSFMAKSNFYRGKPQTHIYNGVYIQAFLSLIWNIDTAGNFITGYYDNDRHEVVMDPVTIWRDYCTYNFVMDITSAIPVDYFYVSIMGMESYASVSNVTFVLLQLYNIFSLVRFRKYVLYTYRLKDGLNDMSFEILFVILIFFFILSWAMWFSLVLPQLVLGEDLFEDYNHSSWIQSSRILHQEFLLQIVTSTMNAMRSILRVITEWITFFTELDYLTGSLLTISGSLCWYYFLFLFLQWISAKNAMEAELQVNRDQIGIFLKQKDLPAFLKKRLKRFYLYRFQSHYFNNRDLLRKLAPSLRKEITTYTCSRLLLHLEVFQSVPKNILTKYIQRMSRELYFPKDVIIQGNTFGGSMYFICSGTVVVHTVSGKEICHLKEGEFFGEIALIAQDRRRTATVTAETITEVYRLESSEFRKITDSFPDVYIRLENYASERYRTIISVEGKFDLTKKIAGLMVE